MSTQPPAPDFIPDDEMPDFISDEDMQHESFGLETATELQPSELEPDPQGFSAAGAANPRQAAERLFVGALKGGGRAAISAVNPADWVRAAKAAVALGYKSATQPAAVLNDAVQGAKDIAGYVATSPEAMGEVLGGTAVGFAAPGMLGKLAKPFVPTELSRAHNIKRALRIPLGKSKQAVKTAHDIEKMAPEISLPVTASAQKLARTLTARRGVAGQAVESAKDALPNYEIPVSSITGRIKPPVGQSVTTTEPVLDLFGNQTGQRAVTRFVPDNPQESARYADAVRHLRELGGDTGEIGAQDALRLKKSVQDMAKEKGAYLTEDAKSAAKAAKVKAAALRETLDELPGPEARALTVANRRFQVAATIEPLASAEATRLRGLPLAARGTEMLLGRAVPGSGFARQALSGLALGQLLDSTAFHTAAAAVKRRVIDAIKSGQPQRARDILVRSAIAEAERHRLAEQALRDQAKGTVGP